MLGGQKSHVGCFPPKKHRGIQSNGVGESLHLTSYFHIDIDIGIVHSHWVQSCLSSHNRVNTYLHLSSLMTHHYHSTWYPPTLHTLYCLPLDFQIERGEERGEKVASFTFQPFDCPFNCLFFSFSLPFSPSCYYYYYFFCLFFSSVNFLCSFTH